MTANRPLISVIAGTGIGGTEKAATIYAAQLSRRGYKVDYIAKPGPRSNFLIQHGVNLVDAPATPSQLLQYLQRARPAVIHHHVPGYPTQNPIYEVLKQLGLNRPKVIETNIFGRLEDPAAESRTDFRCFISSASAAQALFRARLPTNESFFDRQTVLYYPLAAFDDVTRADAEEMRTQLGVSSEEILAIRIGQAGKKWRPWECAAFAKAKKRVPALRLLLMEPPEPIWSQVANGLHGPGIVLHKTTSDFAWQSRMYSAANLTIHASDFGESFGYTIAEAMAAGHPVITRSTPWGDNAQVELVENEVTGYVCWSVPEMARRLVDLASDARLREEMGAASRERIHRLTEVDQEIDLLEEVIEFCINGVYGQKLADRRRNALAFVRSFRQRESATSEAGKTTVDSITATAYACYRKARSRGRALLDYWLRKIRPS